MQKKQAPFHGAYCPGGSQGRPLHLALQVSVAQYRRITVETTMMVVNSRSRRAIVLPDPNSSRYTLAISLVTIQTAMADAKTPPTTRIVHCQSTLLPCDAENSAALPVTIPTSIKTPTTLASTGYLRGDCFSPVMSLICSHTVFYTHRQPSNIGQVMRPLQAPQGRTCQ